MLTNVWKKIQSVLAVLLALPIVAPIGALLESRTFMTSVIVFFVNLVITRDPALANQAGTLQAVLLVMWVGLASKFSLEKFIDAWSNKPGSADAAKAEILAELQALIIKLITDAFGQQQQPIPPSTGQTVTVNTGSSVPEVVIDPTAKA